MALIVTQGDVRTGEPGVRNGQIRTEGGAQREFDDTGVCMVVGTCKGILKPQTPTKVLASELESKLGSGDAYDAARFLYDPSDDTLGASEVWVTRANSAQRGIATLQNGSAADLIDLVSEWYGLSASDIRYKVEDGTSGALGKKVTVTKPGYTDEVGDDLGFQPAFILRRDTSGSCQAARVSISATALTTDKDVGAGYVADLNISFSSFPTLSSLVAEINRNTGYEAIATIPNPETFQCADLDYVSNAEILYENLDDVTLTANASSGTAEPVSADPNVTDVVAGLVIKMSSEYFYLSTITPGTPDTITAVRGYLDTDGNVAYSAVDGGVPYRPLGYVNKAIIDWFNNECQKIDATRDTAGNTGVPANVTTATALSKESGSGDWEGTSTTATGGDWDLAHKAAREPDWNFLVDCSGDATVQSVYLKNAMDWRWQTNRNGHAFCSVGDTSTGATFSAFKTRLKLLNHHKITCLGQNIKRLAGDNITYTEFDAWGYAACLAGMMAGSPFGTDTAKKKLKGELVTDSSWGNLYDNATALIKARGTFGRYENGAWRTVRCLTTWQDDETFWKIEPTIVHSMGWSLRDQNRYLDEEMTSAPQQPNNASVAAALSRLRLEKQRQLNNAPVISYTVRSAVQQGNHWQSNQGVVYKGSTLFGTINTTVVEFSDSTA